MRNLILPLAFMVIALGFFYGCKKSATIHPAISPDVLQIQEARDYFQSNVLHTSSRPSNPNPRTTGAKTLVWEQAQVMQLSNFKGVVVPVHYNDTLYLSSDFSGNKRYALNGLARLLMYKDTAGAYHSEIVTRLPDSNYTGKTGAPFTGMLLVEDWNGHVLFRYMDNGKIIRMEPDQSANDLSAGQRRVITLSTYLICSQIYGYNSGGGETVYWSESGGCNYITMPNTQLMNFINISRVAGGGGGGGTPGIGGNSWIAQNMIVYNGTDPIANIPDYIKCFQSNSTSSYIVTLYIDQPLAGSRSPYVVSQNIANKLNIGHTFLVFQQTNQTGTITRAMGLYPKTFVSPVNPTSPGSLNNDQGHQYNVSLTVTVNGDQFMNILNACSQGNGVYYDLNTNNCTSWALNSLSAGGVNIPTKQGVWPFGGGDNPGDLGEDIRTMPLNSNMSRSTQAQKGPNNNGSCQ